MGILLGPELSRLLDQMRESIENMSASRKVRPGGFVISTSIHAQLKEAADRLGVGFRTDPKGEEPQQLLGLPFRVSRITGWVLLNNRQWAELRPS